MHMLKVKRNNKSLGIWVFEILGSRIRLGTESWPTTETAIIECKGSHSNKIICVQTIIFAVIHIEDILRNKPIYFIFQNMTALCDSNAGKPKI